MLLSFNAFPLALSQLDPVARDTRKLSPARIAAALVIIGLAALTLDLTRALCWGTAVLACEAATWLVTRPFALSRTVSRAQRLLYLVTALTGCVTWLALSLMYWADAARGSQFTAQLIWSALLLNSISFAFRSNLALVLFAAPVSATMILTPILAPRFAPAQQAMAVVGLLILGGYSTICAARNVKAARIMAETERDLEQARAKAEAANQAKSVFLATMSHEIRTPLNGVLGMAQAMANDPLPGRQRERLEVIRQSGEMLLSQLNDVLDLARVETGRLELEDGVVDPQAIANAAQSAFGPQAAEKDVQIVVEIEDAARGAWRGDPTRVRQIAFNLVSNAVKFTAQGSVSIRIAAETGGLRLAVSDTGPGIPADRLPTLFDRFVQADASTTRRFGGSGLGLAICRELVALMGGSVEVDSTLGEGSAFTVRLPLTRIAGPSRRAALEATPADMSEGLRVLAAEDNPMNRLVLKTLLDQVGVAVTFAEDGAQAVDAWTSARWDVVLMDMQMPVMDGLAATGAIRAAERAQGRERTPIIALTANAMAHQVSTYMDAGIDQVVPKPLQFAALMAAISEVLVEQEAAA